MTTEQVLKEMLTENTGIALCDSGGIYGRHWEENQERAFDNEPYTKVDWEDRMVTHNVYHWLCEVVTYDEDMDDKLQKFIKKNEDSSSYLEDMENFVIGLWEENPDQVKGAHGCDLVPYTVNTYNGNDCLSQVLQYTYFELDGQLGGKAYILLQIHNGCDVRGGYTRPRAFRVYDDYPSIMDNASIHITCPECGVSWSSDDGGGYFDCGCLSNVLEGDPNQLELDLERTEEEWKVHHIKEKWCKNKLEEEWPEDGICPCCKKGKLSVSW